MRFRAISRHLTIGAALCFVAALAYADQPMAVEWTTPGWVDATEPFEGTAKIEGTVPEPVMCRYMYADGSKGSVECRVQEDGAYAFRVPGATDPQVGEVKLTIEAGAGEPDVAQSAAHAVPVAYVEELDITGNPPVVLPYELGGEEYLVRYIPCCNIFGGVMLAKRIPVNPLETGEGLPGTLVSDFVDLQPDDLTTSTAGTHMRFGIKPEMAESVAMYTFDWKRDAWREVRTYEVNAEEGYLEVHCPEGGVFVLGEKD